MLQVSEKSKFATWNHNWDVNTISKFTSLWQFLKVQTNDIIMQIMSKDQKTAFLLGDMDKQRILFGDLKEKKCSIALAWQDRNQGGAGDLNGKHSPLLS